MAIVPQEAENEILLMARWEYCNHVWLAEVHEDPEPRWSDREG